MKIYKLIDEKNQYKSHIVGVHCYYEQINGMVFEDWFSAERVTELRDVIEQHGFTIFKYNGRRRVAVTLDTL